MGAAELQARRTRARATAVMFFASLGLLIGASLGLGFLLGRTSSSSVPSGTAPTRVTEQLPAVAAPKTQPCIDFIPPSKVNVIPFPTTIDLPSTAPDSQALSPNVGVKKSGTESRDIAKPQVLTADTAPPIGAKPQPVTLEAKNRTPVTILNPAGDPVVDAPSRNSHWLKLAEEARHQAQESKRAPRKRLLLKIADTYERLAQLATEETADEEPRRHRSRR